LTFTILHGKIKKQYLVISMRENLTIVSVLNAFPDGQLITKIYLVTFSKNYIEVNNFRFDYNLNIIALNCKDFNSIDVEVALDLEPNTQNWAVKVHQHTKNIYQTAPRSVTIRGNVTGTVINTGNNFVNRQMS
jgi:hypothetical protein